MFLSWNSYTQFDPTLTEYVFLALTQVHILIFFWSTWNQQVLSVSWPQIIYWNHYLQQAFFDHLFCATKWKHLSAHQLEHIFFLRCGVAHVELCPISILGAPTTGALGGRWTPFQTVLALWCDGWPGVAQQVPIFWQPSSLPYCSPYSVPIIPTTAACNPGAKSSWECL